MSDDAAPDAAVDANAGMMAVKWRTVALVAIVVALAGGTVAAIVASVNDAETLSVVALALAVLAFVVQIIVFIAQAAAASRQEVQVTEIYGRTLQTLAAIQEKSEGINRVVTTMSDKLLGAVIGKSIAEAQAEGVTSEQLAEDVTDRVKELARSAVERQGGRRRRMVRKRPVTDSSMYALPSGPALDAALAALGRLSPLEMGIIVDLALDQARTGGLDERGPIGPGLRTINPYAAPKLVELDLVARRRVPWAAEPVFQLTDLGKDVGRALLGRDESLPPAVMDVRQRLREYEAEFRRSQDPEVKYKDIPIEDHRSS